MKTKTTTRRKKTKQSKARPSLLGPAAAAMHIHLSIRLPQFEPDGYEPTPEDWDLWGEGSELREQVRLRLPGDSRLRWIIETAFPEAGVTPQDGGVHPFPLVSRMREALAAFAALDPKEAQDIMNGWAYVPPEKRSERSDWEADGAVTPDPVVCLHLAGSSYRYQTVHRNDRRRVPDDQPPRGAGLRSAVHAAIDHDRTGEGLPPLVGDAVGAAHRPA